MSKDNAHLGQNLPKSAETAIISQTDALDNVLSKMRTVWLALQADSALLDDEAIEDIQVVAFDAVQDLLAARRGLHQLVSSAPRVLGAADEQ